MKTIRADKKEPAIANVAIHPAIGSFADLPIKINDKNPRRGKAGMSQTRSIILIRPESLSHLH